MPFATSRTVALRRQRSQVRMLSGAPEINDLSKTVVRGAKLVAPVLFYDSREGASQVHCGDGPARRPRWFNHADLKSLVLKLLEQVAELQRTVAAQRDEIARLKGGPGRPNSRRSGMEQATEAKPAGSNQRRPRGGTRSKLSIDEERTVKVAAPPRGSRFKGYTSFLVQDLMIRRHVVNFRREHWLTPDGKMVTAPLPASVQGHFGPELRRFVLAQYHQGQVTVPRLVTRPASEFQLT